MGQMKMQIADSQLKVVLSILLVLCLANQRTECANVLAILPYNAKSHFIVMEPLLKGLASRGHSVTVMSTFPQKDPIDNYKDIDMTYRLPTYLNTITLNFIREKMGDPRQCSKVMFDIGHDLCEAIYKSKEFHDLFNQTSTKYDLLITEIFGADCFLPVAHRLDVPIVSIVTSVALPWTNDRVGNPDNPAYIPNYFYGYGDQMTFEERVSNFLTLQWSKLANYLSSDIPSHESAKTYFGQDIPPLHEIARQRTSLVLVNSYFTVNQPRPFVPGVVEIGGIHLNQPGTLPHDVHGILDKATNGFVFFSLGSLVKGSSLDRHVIDAFLNAFSKLSQTVIWKFDVELKDAPPNVIIRKWWPQREILVHKNIRCFITHGGLSSTLEAVSSGVPVIGLPLFADQSGNVNNIARRGAGIRMNYDEITYESLMDALNKILHDKRYMENAKEMSRRFNDRPLPPLENAIFWVEYVIRHKGAAFMRSAGAGLPFYQYFLLDVIAFIIVVLILSLYITYKISKAVYNFVFNFLRNRSIKNIKVKST